MEETVEQHYDDTPNEKLDRLMELLGQGATGMVVNAVLEGLIPSDEEERDAFVSYAQRWLFTGNQRLFGAERKAAGERINPETCEVFFTYGSVLDPYGDAFSPIEGDNYGRTWWARDPEERYNVHVSDLPQATYTHADFGAKMRADDKAGWEALTKDTGSDQPVLADRDAQEGG